MKTIERLKARNPDKIEGYYRDCDGLWVDLHYGWQLDGCHTIHTDTVREALAEFARVEPCECPDCVPEVVAEHPPLARYRCPGCGYVTGYTVRGGSASCPKCERSMVLPDGQTHEEDPS